MNIVLNPTGIVDITRPRQGIADIAGADFTEIVLDLSMFCNPYELENIEQSQYQNPVPGIIHHQDTLYEFINLILDKCTDAKLNLSIAAAPYLCRDTKRKDLNGLLQTLGKESIKACGEAGCHYLIVRPMSAGILNRDIWKVNREFYLGLVDCAKEWGMMILLENQCRDVGGHLTRGVCSDGRQAAQWVDRLNEEAGGQYFGFSMDVGVCNLCGQNMYDFCSALGDRLKVVILRDCDGSRENALLPFTCVNRGQHQTDWLNLIRGLRKIRFGGSLMLNLGDTAAAFSPLLRPGLLQLAKSIGDYMKWQIEIEGMLKGSKSRVLFGAGNMCRNYMKCYGAQYPPLYTCDNNKVLWGTSFCGLEVKAPECLKSLPDDCVVFICNIYYREIEIQLRDMGITNRIEYFNDEYMTTFYFDRLARED